MKTTREDFEACIARGLEVWTWKETGPHTMELDRRITRFEDLPAEGNMVAIDREAIASLELSVQPETREPAP